MDEIGVHPQLAQIVRELDQARARLHDVADALTPEQWGTRPAAGEWSVAECVTHLNLTSRAFLPLIRRAIDDGREGKVLGAGPFRRDPVGWFVGWLTEPPFRIRVRTTAPFVPAGVEPRDRGLAEFDALQEQLTRHVTEADGLDLGRLRIVSPFDARLRYNLYSCFRLIPAHQRHHLGQAHAVLRALHARQPGR